MSRTDWLLSRVARRQRLNSLLRWFARLVIVLGCIYAALLLGTRLGSLTPLRLDPLTVLIVPAAALLLALVLHRRTGRDSAARLVDNRLETKDLFLTTAKLKGAPGEYGPLVKRDAESR